MSKLDDLRAEAEAMTEAPWEATECPPGWPIAEIATPSSVIAVPRRDATGIVALRNAAPALLDVAAAAEALVSGSVMDLEELRDALMKACDRLEESLP